MTAVLNRIMMVNEPKELWKVREAIGKEVIDPYMSQLIDREVLIGAIYEEAPRDIVNRIQLIEARNRLSSAVRRLRAKSIMPSTKADIKKMGERLKRKLRPIFSTVWHRICDRLKNPNAIQVAHHNRVLNEADRSIDGIIWANDLIGDSLNDVPEELWQTIADGLVNEYKSAANRFAIGAGLSFDKDMVDQNAKAWIELNFYKKGMMVDMTNSLRDEIAKEIADLYDEGITIDEMVDILSTELPDSQDYILERIARTESAMAATAGALDQARGSGLDLVAYFNINADACEDCEAMAADNPYELSDPEVDELPHPNCRDAWSFVTRDDWDETMGDEEE